MRHLRSPALPVIAAASLLASCIAGVGSLAGYDNLGTQIRFFYEDRAWEEGATCLAPRMSIAGYEVVEDTPERLVLNVRYRYDDRTFGDMDDGLMIRGLRCQGWSERQFTMTRTTDGTPVVTAMSGPQRG